ncbi:MAG: hypothetical protein ACYCO0_03610 [Candidatus Micrarchaeaceae archaeon]
MDEPLVIGIPAKNEYMIGRTIADICATLKIIKKDPIFAYGVGTNICGGRDLILRLAKENLKKDSSRMLWLDSDIWIKTPPNELAKCLQDADDKDYNIIAPYRRMDNGSAALSSISKVPGEVLVWDDVEKLEQYEKVSWAGLGFYYGFTPFNYTFHMTGSIGEDYYFFTENKIEVRVDKRIILHHYKNIFI